MIILFLVKNINAQNTFTNIENKAPAWFINLSNEEKWQMCKDLSELVNDCLYELESTKNVMLEAKYALGDSNIILNKVFIPNWSIGLNMFGGLTFDLNRLLKDDWINKTLIISVPIEKYFLKHFSIELAPYIQIYEKIGCGLGLGFKIIL